MARPRGGHPAGHRSSTSAAGEFFWLDLDGVDNEAHDLLLEVFHIHHLAVDDAQHFGQRPKLEDYDDFTYMVVHGAVGRRSRPPTRSISSSPSTSWSPSTAVRCPAMDEVRQRIAHRRPSDLESPQIALIYLVIDQLVDSFFPMLDQFDDQIDELEDAILVKPTDAQLGTLFAMKRSLITIRKVITPAAGHVRQHLLRVVEHLPGVTDEGLRYMRDVYDHLIRISDLVDGYRDLLSGVMDTHLSTVSNRLNVVMKQLTIIATVFLPLSFLTGFFGQNFSWLVAHIIGRAGPSSSSGWASRCVSAVGLLYLFRKRGWLGGPTS